MSPALTPAKALARAWKEAGALQEATAALVMGPQGFDLARAVRDTLSPRALVMMHAEAPPARARFETTPSSLPELAAERPGAFDLVAMGGGLESGDLAEVRSRLDHIATLLRPGGVLTATIETLAAPDAEQGSWDHLLFPHLARAGDLGEVMQARAPLPASAWRALIQTAGFGIIALDGARSQGLPPEFRATHEARLGAYDETELMGASLRLVARRTETVP